MPELEWWLGGLQWFLTLVILIAVWQIAVLVAGWVKRRWL